MADISFAQVVWAQNREDEIEQANERFRRTLAYCSSNTLFQLLHFDLIEKGIDLSDYVFNNDWNATVLKKVKEYVEEVTKILQGDEFKKNEEAMKLVSKIISAQAREKK